MDFELYRAGDVRLQRGGLLEDAQLAYKPTVASLAIRAISSSSARRSAVATAISNGRSAAIGNGVSSSPAQKPGEPANLSARHHSRQPEVRLPVRAMPTTLCTDRDLAERG
jgi:hypothetical protein